MQALRQPVIAEKTTCYAILASRIPAKGLAGAERLYIRIAIGAQSGEIARRVTADVFRMVLAGAAAGVGLGMLSIRYIATLLYQVRPTDPAMLAMPSAIILGAALLAALPAVFHALRIDPVAMLRAD
jgi:ABC-type antimicrobial peptide transport system permease subunit